MGSCWLAASNATAEKISLKDSRPVDGFKYMTNAPNPTLRSCLVDVCNNGGRNAFTVAGENMDALQMTSKRIGDERIPMVFQRLGPSTLGEDQYEYFKDALEDFSNDAKTCAKLAAEIREAFGTWGRMVGELHVVTENQKGLTAIDAERTRIDEAVAKIEETHTAKAVEAVKKEVTRASKNVERQQKNLDTMIDKVPGPWAAALQTAVSSFAQALPSILGAAASARNPAAAGAALAAGQAGAAASNTASSGTPQTKVPVLADPAYATAATIQNLVNLYYEYLGGDKGNIKWDKFRETTTTDSKDTTTGDDSKDTPQGLAYILGTLKGQKANIDVTDTAPNKKLLGAYDSLIKLSEELQAHLRKQNELSASKDPAEDVVKQWKATCRKARDDILELAAAAKAGGSSNVPTAFGNVQIPPPDLSAQTAQLNTAMQGVQIAQTALDNAENAYQAAIEKQERTAKAMATIQAKLQKLHSTGKTLEEIKSVLRDCIDVLADQPPGALLHHAHHRHRRARHAARPGLRERPRQDGQACPALGGAPRRRHRQADHLCVHTAAQGLLLAAAGHRGHVLARAPRPYRRRRGAVLRAVQGHSAQRRHAGPAGQAGQVHQGRGGQGGGAGVGQAAGDAAHPARPRQPRPRGDGPDRGRAGPLQRRPDRPVRQAGHRSRSP
ncbi:hypothetical protein B0I37DRAFT_194901 [Chaetomium sp. MPI-CAGE-AT-0009]|nr:hypothetical protein B0I37DRAFT_194901 [Chaetomium sp. MPI-CAGE-AT-0009]